VGKGLGLGMGACQAEGMTKKKAKSGGTPEEQRLKVPGGKSPNRIPHSSKANFQEKNEQGAIKGLGEGYGTFNAADGLIDSE